MSRNTQSTTSRDPQHAKLVSVRQAAVLLATSPRTVWRLLGLGELEKVQIGRSVRIPSSSVESFIARGGAK
ncbi:MAG: helix-turn-helix domain-containing protein [Phycisphaeraceae bacterium]|nr:helix-turn-helix domain-containing protein [Phycisphaeraceae bacterium]